MNVVAGKWCGVRVEGEGACTIQAPGQGGVQNYRCKASLRGYPRLDLYTAFAVMLESKSSRQGMIIGGGTRVGVIAHRFARIDPVMKAKGV